MTMTALPLLFALLAQPEQLPPDGLKALRHPDAAVRLKAAAVLVRLGPLAKFAAVPLRDAFKQEKDALVKVKLAEAIWTVERPLPSVLVPYLKTALQDKDAEVRRDAAIVLGQMGGKARLALSGLVDALADEDSQVQLAVIVAIGEMGPTAKAAVGPLLATIREENKDYLIDTMVATALGKVGPAIVPELTEALKNKQPRHRLAAAYALGEVGPAARTAVPAMVDLLDEKESLQAVIVLPALGKIGKDARAAAAKVEPFLKSDDPALRLEAALTLFLIAGQTGHLGVILDCLTDDKADLRYQACQAVKHFGPAAKDGLPALEKLLSAKDADLRLAAANAHWNVTGQPDAALKVLAKALDDEDSGVRRRTLETLEEIGPAAAALAPAVQEASRDEDDAVRQAARSALVRIKKASK